MKKIKIFALPSHQEKERTHGVDFARIIQPMTHLNSYNDGEVEFKVKLFDINKKTDWLHVAKNYDIIYLNYINNPWGYAGMGSMARKHGVKLILDLDDALWNLKPDNGAFEIYQKGSEPLRNFTAICNDVDYMTTTNSYLKNIIINNTDKRPEKVKVLPNYIDLDLYKHRSKFKDDGQIVISHFGSTTHFNDLAESEFAEGINRIMSEYPQVTFRTIGAFLQKFKMRWGRRYENPFGHQDIYHWIQDEDKFPKFMSETDIVVTPLTDDIYNRGKSGIKFLEASSAGIPGVWQKIRQYEEVVDGQNGLLATRADDWYKHIKSLIDDPKLRKEMGEKAFATVKDSWTIQGNIKDYANFFKLMLDKE